MAKRILFQGITQEDHLSAVKHVLQIDHPTRVIMSVAFMNARGLSLLREDIKQIADKTMIFAGVQNGITSAQGLKTSLELGCLTYAVDTGAQFIFHPKIYMSRNPNTARLIVGSANLTNGGLKSNIEASLLMDLELREPDDLALVELLENLLDEMIVEFPKNVVLISEFTMIEDLLVSGQVVDESKVTTNFNSRPSSRLTQATVPRMNLKTRVLETPPTELTTIKERRTLVWKSKPLTRRALNIPTSPNTNRTGSMLFTKGEFTSIDDHRHYFRDEVFANLDWHFENDHKEIAEARFQFIVDGVDFGMFTLKIAHDTRTDTRTYKQRNSMTQLHWDQAQNIIGKEEFLGRTLLLYRDEIENGLFVIELE